jgi:DNA-binding GntR family transcriptional regulator
MDFWIQISVIVGRVMISATGHVLDAVRGAILSGELAAGETLRQEELAERFGVSRMPVREAIQRLESEGLVEVLPSRRVRVAALSRAEIADVYDMRAALEPLAVRLAVPRLTRAQLRDAAHALEAADDEQDADTFGVRNAAFHLSLMDACERPRLLNGIASLLDVSDRYQRAALRDERHNDLVRAEHAALLEAARAGDAERAAELTEAHVRGAGTRLLELFGRP